MKFNRMILGLFAVAMGLMLFVSCSSEPKQQTVSGKQENAPAKEAMTGQMASAEATAGIEWKVPSGWLKGGEKPMRAATYLVGSGDAQAECAVFYFGAGQGGEVDANISRWISQMKQPDGSESGAKAVRSEVKSSCCQITTIEVSGTYQASSGPMMQVTAEKQGFTLLGRIVPGPQGNVFFKLFGPKEVVSKIKEDFLGMLRSVNKQAA